MQDSHPSHVQEVGKDLLQQSLSTSICPLPVLAQLDFAEPSVRMGPALNDSYPQRC
jgi:hypothetical protein